MLKFANPLFLVIVIITDLFLCLYLYLCCKQIKVIGSYGARARQDLPKLVRLAETGVFKLDDAVSRKYKFDEAVRAFEDLDQGKIVSRAVVEIG